MIPLFTTLNLADNTGAHKLKVIGIPGTSKRMFANLGDIVTCVVKGADATGMVKNHTVVKAVIVRARKEKRRKDGSYIRFDDNAAIVVTADGTMVGTRVFGPVARELRDAGYAKIASLAKEVW
ncbi:MAG TPA: 50S ribosomal protein L14 [candidate division WWE3 bacterium]|uniref:Large ribosomal subunit protein uL14 n=1 Tax=candidate division WWE3 bacterium TaxID=2053526 RepID=A0A7C1DG55_UNCKA|nr:50S ribosomal protein L14 [candidate division WWE3 bacterium]